MQEEEFLWLGSCFDDDVVIVLKNKAAGKAIVACSCLFVATFATTWAVSSWTYVAETFPYRTRTKGTSMLLHVIGD